jgi:LysM repeat protein
MAVALLVVVALLVLGCARLRSPKAVPPVSAPAPPVSAPAPAGAAYTVKPGDTLERIAAWHGASAEDVAQHNDLDGAEPLAPGHHLVVPLRPLAEHAVRSGETISGLARWYGTEEEALIRLNDVADVRRLAVGRVLRIPATARRSDPPPPPPVPTPAPAVGAADAAIAEAYAAFDAADFDAALEAAARARTLLPAQPDADEDRRRLARVMLLTGMAQVALERDAEARTSFRGALAHDPSLALDPAQFSPKIVDTFERSRGLEPAAH